MQIIELLTPSYEAAWLPWAVQYFFLVGVDTGAALLASFKSPITRAPPTQLSTQAGNRPTSRRCSQKVHLSAVCVSWLMKRASYGQACTQ